MLRQKRMTTEDGIHLGKQTVTKTLSYLDGTVDGTSEPKAWEKSDGSTEKAKADGDHAHISKINNHR